MRSDEHPLEWSQLTKHISLFSLPPAPGKSFDSPSKVVDCDPLSRRVDAARHRSLVDQTLNQELAPPPQSPDGAGDFPRTGS